MGWRESIAKVLAGKVGGPWEGGIRAYHSSPHDFDKVDFSKLRTGEGANVYGAGHYMAENPAVSGRGGQYWNQFVDRFGGPEPDLARLMKRTDFDHQRAFNVTKQKADDLRAQIAEYQDIIERGKGSQSAFLARGHVKDLGEQLAQREAQLEMLNSGQVIGPRTYEMNLRAKPEELLDWDKPMTAQPQVAERMREGFPYYPFKDAETGQSVYTGFVGYPYGGGKTRDEAKAIISERMAGAGIPGIRYLDEGSRITNTDARNMLNQYGSREAALAEAHSHAGPRGPGPYWQKIIEQLQPPTYNYVGTDPSKLDILAKYGLAGAVAGPTLGAFTRQDKYEEAR